MITNVNWSSLSPDRHGYNTSLEDSNITNINGTGDTSSARYSLAESIIIGTVLSLFVILAIAGNILVCVAVFTDRRLKRLNNLFIVSLAIADLLVAVLVMTFAVINDISEKWYFGSVFCNVWISSDIMCSTASILNLCVISLDRYIHIRDPFKYDSFMTWKKVAAIISLVWIISIIMSFLPIHLEWHKNESDRSQEPVEDACFFELNPTYAVSSSTISFFIPCIVMLAIYIQLYVYARRHLANIKKTTPGFSSANASGKGSNSSDHKAAITLGVIVGVFLFCWMPFFIVNLTTAFCNCIPDLVFKILTWLGYVNSCLNPIIYSIFNKEFRDAFRRILCPKSCRCVKNQRNGYITNHKSGSMTVNRTEYIMHPYENGNKQKCKEPLCADKMTSL